MSKRRLIYIFRHLNNNLARFRNIFLTDFIEENFLHLTQFLSFLVLKDTCEKDVCERQMSALYLNYGHVMRFINLLIKPSNVIVNVRPHQMSLRTFQKSS